MNDIEKKLEALKAEFLEKLEALKKEAEMQKKQEEWKFGEKYFYSCCYGWNNCMMCSVQAMSRIGKMRMNTNFIFFMTERQATGNIRTGVLLIFALGNILTLRKTLKKQQKS